MQPYNLKEQCEERRGMLSYPYLTFLSTCYSFKFQPSHTLQLFFFIAISKRRLKFVKNEKWFSADGLLDLRPDERHEQWIFGVSNIDQWCSEDLSKITIKWRSNLSSVPRINQPRKCYHKCHRKQQFKMISDAETDDSNWSGKEDGKSRICLWISAPPRCIWIKWKKGQTSEIVEYFSFNETDNYHNLFQIWSVESIRPSDGYGHRSATSLRGLLCLQSAVHRYWRWHRKHDAT